jgi:transcriptional regulator with XRE-family HTH domain
MLSAAQIRAARALLGWRQHDLAKAAKVGIATVRRIEILDGPVSGYASTQLSIEQALKTAGIKFIDADDSGGVGVRLISAQAKKRGKAKG